jgi:alpha-L-arabinofuranosidase
MSLLSNADIHAHNTFDQREVVTPQTKSLSVSQGVLVVEFPPASVVALNIELT